MQAEARPEWAYARLRMSLERYGKAAHELDEAQRHELDGLLQRELAIQARLLGAPEAASVLVPESALRQALEGIASRYDSLDAFHEDLRRNGLSPAGLETALQRELLVEAVTERLLAGVEPTSDEQLEAYYRKNVAQFSLPETRELHHILLTINDDYHENSATEARRRMREIEAECGADAERFAELAMRHSECPTSLQGGRLGRIKPGQLYAELERVAFELEEGGFSAVVDSPMGLHLLYCERCYPPQTKSLDEVREDLREHLDEHRRRLWLRDWLSQAD